MEHIQTQQILRGLLGGLFRIAGCLLALVALICVLILIQGRRDDAPAVGTRTAVVLGAAQWNGDPSPVLQARLDHAFDLYRRGLVGRIILTGGVGRGDTISEAAAGRQYLLERGAPAEALLLEEQGTTTWESLQNTAVIARSQRISAVLLVSDPFHMLRALKMARDLELTAYASPTTSSPISGNTAEEARYVLREAWAYLMYVFARR